MNLQETYIHSTNKTQYTILLTWQQNLGILINEKFGLTQWKGSYTSQNIKQITTKTGYQLQYNDFVDLLRKALSQKDLSCYVDILSSQDLQNLKNKKNGMTTNKASSSKPSKRYIILTYMTKQTKFHYPISLSPHNVQRSTQKLKQIYQQLRIQLETARSSALNDTQKTDNSNQSFSINYQKKNNKNHSKVRQVDQFRSQNQILKAKLARLEEQVDKKKANIQIQAAIERTKQLKESIQTANLELVDWKNNIQQQQQTQTDLKKQLVKLHKKICGLLVTEKQITAKKKGQQTQKELNGVRNHMKKNTNELQKLKRQLQNNKNKVKELELKAKKLNSQKEVIRKGRRGPYSSTGSVRSYNSYNSYSSGKKSYGSNMSSSSKAKSNYSYNSYKFR